MPVQVTHNNDGHFYTIDVDIAKEGAQVFDLSTYFKARVGDNHVGLRVRWFWQGQVFNTVGKKPRVEGAVGQYSFKEGKNGTRDLVMSPDASGVSFNGDIKDCEPGGYATYYFPGQMFPQEGLFKGTIGLVDDLDEGAHYTSVDIWFKVYPQAGGAQMGRACDFYISELDKAIKEAEDDLTAAKKSMQKVVDDFTAKMNDLSNQITTQANTDKAALAALETRIEQDNIVTQPQLDEFEKTIKSEIDKQNAILDGMRAKWHDIEVIDYKPTRDGKAHTLSESYASVDEARKDYPAATSLADTKDWCAITEAIQESQKQGKNVYVAAGHYVVNRTITLPNDVKFYGEYQNTRIFASDQMCEDSKKSPLAILEYDDEGQPPIYVENIHVLGNTDQSNQIIGLHLGGNRASKFTNLIVSNAYAHGVLVHATNPNSADVENTTFEHYWQVQSGSFSIQTNPDIPRGNITDFAVYDSQITSLDVRDENKTTTSQPAVEIINNDSSTVVKTIYGIEFNRVFLHAQANNLVRIVGNHASRATHSINFDFIKGELHDEHGDISSLGDKYYLFHLERCRHIMVDHATQLLYSGYSYVKMINCAFCDIKTAGILYLGWLHSDAKIFDIDDTSYENHINLVGMDIYKTAGGTAFEKNPDLGYDYGYAYDSMDLFDKMIDRGSDNHITGWQLAQTLTLNNEPERLKQITSGKIDGLLSANQNGVTSSVESNSHLSKHVFAKGITGSSQMLTLPLLYKRTSGYLVSMRAIGDPEDIEKLNVLTGSNFYKIPTDQKFHVWAGICPTNVLMNIGIQKLSDDPLKNDVTIEIEYLDAFIENKVPYYPDFVALPAPKVNVDNYYEGTITHPDDKSANI